MLKIGLTGGIGSGKTTVSDLFARHNNNSNQVDIIDTDVIARQIVEINKPAYNKVLEVFGEEILNSDNSLNRKALRNLVFSDTRLRKKLESITHPAIHYEVNKRLSESTANYCIIVIPLLFETSSEYDLDRVLVVNCDKVQQINRVSKRDKTSEADVEAIIQSQVTQAFRLSHADDVIQNNSDIDSLAKQVDKLHAFYLEQAKIAK